MAYIFKKVMKSGDNCFFICKNRYNSKETFIIYSKPKQQDESLGKIINKTGEIVIYPNHGFKPAVIEKLKAKINSL